VTPALWVAIAVAVLAAIGGVGALVGAILTHKRGTAQDVGARLALVEGRLAAMETKYSKLWAYCRQLIDYAYRHRREGSPDLPDMPDDLT